MGSNTTLWEQRSLLIQNIVCSWNIASTHQHIQSRYIVLGSCNMQQQVCPIHFHLRHWNPIHCIQDNFYPRVQYICIWDFHPRVWVSCSFHSWCWREARNCEFHWTKQLRRTIAWTSFCRCSLLQGLKNNCCTDGTDFSLLVMLHKYICHFYLNGVNLHTYLLNLKTKFLFV